MAFQKIVNGIQNMLKKRGITEFCDCETKIGTAFISGNDTLIYIPSFNGDRIVKINNEILLYIFFLAENNGLKNCIIIYNDIAPPANDIIKSHKIFNLELFTYKTMMYDPTAHQKVPRHTKLSDKEVEEELKGIKPSELPHILSTDIQVRFNGWKKGNIIRIERSEGPYYRIVQE